MTKEKAEGRGRTKKRLKGEERTKEKAEGRGGQKKS